jgi:hypothetical protein
VKAELQHDGVGGFRKLREEFACKCIVTGLDGDNARPDEKLYVIRRDGVGIAPVIGRRSSRIARTNR